jgi:cytochrome c-type biogenesis protein
MHASELLTSFTLGLLATTSPCVFPLYPGYLAFLSGSQAGRADGRVRFLYGFAILAGVLTMMVSLGALIAALAVPIGSVLRILIPVADGLIFILGALLVLNINPFKQIPTIQAPVLRHPLANAYLYGFLYGPIVLPCSGPLVVAVFALSFTAGEAFSRLFVFLWFGLGFGTPLLILSLIAGSAQRAITRFFAVHARWVNLAGGVILMAIALYDLSVNWSNITL